MLVRIVVMKSTATRHAASLLFALVLSLCFSPTATAQVTAEWSAFHGVLGSQYKLRDSNNHVIAVVPYTYFRVTSGSGYIDLTATLEETGISTTTRMWVEEGIYYRAEIRLDVDGTRSVQPGEYCFDITYASPAFSTPGEGHLLNQIHWPNPDLPQIPYYTCPATATILVQEDSFQLNASDGIFADRVRITWNEMTGATEYRLFRCSTDSENSCGAAIGSTNSNGFDDMGGVEEERYFYRVKACTPGNCGSFSEHDEGYRSDAVDDHGNSCATATSVGVNSTTPGAIERPTPGAPGDVDFFRIDLPSAGLLTVSTTGLTDTSGILFDSACAKITEKAFGGEGANFLISEELGAGTYYVRVYGDSFSAGTYQFVSSFGGTVPTLSKPTGVNATNGAFTDRVRVTWNSVAAATQYQVFRCTNNASSSCGSPLGTPTGTSFNDTGGAADTTYWYRVKACTASECSDFSATDTGYRSSSAQGEDCDEAFVQLDDDAVAINVTATGGDDTANIQCALDAATIFGIPKVNLGKNTYYIRNVMVEGFKGSFEGTSIASTKLEVIGGSINCADIRTTGRFPAAIKFVGGEPVVRNMTIAASDEPCSAGGWLVALLHFTGEANTDPNCPNNIIFGAVNRVKLVGLSESMVSMGVMAGPEGGGSLECQNPLLGTFKLNRSELIGRRGIVTSMKSGAQVDINYNTFTNYLDAIQIIDANQSTTILSNTISKLTRGEPEQAFPWSIYLRTNPGGPNKNRVSIHNNDFKVPDIAGGAVIELLVLDPASQLTAAFTNNKFSLNGSQQTGIQSFGVSNGFIAANIFSGGLGVGVHLSPDLEDSEGNTLLDSSEDWSIVGNTGIQDLNPSGGDIILGPGTSNCIVGPGQTNNVDDQGTDNYQL